MCLNISMQFCPPVLTVVVINASFLFSFQDKLKDFLEKKEKGELLIQKASNLLQSILKKVGVMTAFNNRIKKFSCLNLVFLKLKLIENSFN